MEEKTYHYNAIGEVPWDIQKYKKKTRKFFLFCDACGMGGKGKGGSRVERLIWANYISRYYHQRRSIFSRYDDGIWMTEDAWYGVTPEPVAKYALPFLF